MSGERGDHTLQTTALVNEAYLKLVDQRVNWQNRAHFFAIAAQIMRRILIDHSLLEASCRLKNILAAPRRRRKKRRNLMTSWPRRTRVTGLLLLLLPLPQPPPRPAPAHHTPGTNRYRTRCWYSRYPASSLVSIFSSSTRRHSRNGITKTNGTNPR